MPDYDSPKMRVRKIKTIEIYLLWSETYQPAENSTYSFHIDISIAIEGTSLEGFWRSLPRTFPTQFCYPEHIWNLSL
jgi:hypothetical protein